MYAHRHSASSQLYLVARDVVLYMGLNDCRYPFEADARYDTIAKLGIAGHNTGSREFPRIRGPYRDPKW